MTPRSVIPRIAVFRHGTKAFRVSMQTTLRPMQRFGPATATPNRYIILQRLGHLRFPGRVADSGVVSGLDRAFLIPSGFQSAAYLADQITVANQGVVIGWFALWSVADPARVGRGGRLHQS